MKECPKALISGCIQVMVQSKELEQLASTSLSWVTVTAVQVKMARQLWLNSKTNGFLLVSTADNTKWASKAMSLKKFKRRWKAKTMMRTMKTMIGAWEWCSQKQSLMSSSIQTVIGSEKSIIKTYEKSTNTSMISTDKVIYYKSPLYMMLISHVSWNRKFCSWR